MPMNRAPSLTVPRSPPPSSSPPQPAATPAVASAVIKAIPIHVRVPLIIPRVLSFALCQCAQEHTQFLTTLAEAMVDETLNRPCGGRYGNVVEAVGNTPLVELPRLSPKAGVRIFVKLEGRN